LFYQEQTSDIVTKTTGGAVEYSDSSTQAEQLKAIGSKLSHEREARSVSLAAVATKTYIPLRLLTAIEAGRLDLLPEPVFVQGFIRRYADTLGLDGTALSKEFAIESPVPQYEAELLPLEPVEVLSEPSKRPLWLYALGGAIGLGAIALIIASLVNHPKKAEPPTSKPLTNSTTSQTAKPQATAPSSASLSPNASAKPVAVNLNVTDKSWVQVIVDGKVAFEGTLQKGTQQAWGGQKQVIISAGNAGGVLVSYNNGVAKPLGAPGKVVEEVKFPPTP
jgi:cytoskeleton protein RodZ